MLLEQEGPKLTSPDYRSGQQGTWGASRLQDPGQTDGVVRIPGPPEGLQEQPALPPHPTPTAGQLPGRISGCSPSSAHVLAERSKNSE